MARFRSFLKRLCKDKKGATAIEYALLAALIAVTIIGASKAVSTQMNATLKKVEAEMKAANNKK